MPRSILRVSPVGVKRALEGVIPAVQSKLETAREDEIEKGVERVLNLPERSLWCRVLFIYPFNNKERQVFFATHDDKVLVVRMVYEKGQWIRALPNIVQTAKTRRHGIAS